jgi:tight adherence protein B
VIRRTVAAACVFGWMVVGPVLPMARASGDEVRIDSVDVSEHPDVVVTVEMPVALAGEDLPAEAFAVYEDGTRIDAGVWTAIEEPIDIVLAVDTSGSMAGDAIADARSAGIEFIERLPSSARVAVVGFGDGVVVHHPLGSDLDVAQEAIQGLEAGGETALYDAVVSAVDLLEDGEARRLVVLLSDGGDTVSATSQGTAAAVLEAAEVEFHAVALQSDEADRTALDTLAAAGEGAVIAAADAAALGEVYRDLADRLAGRYRIAFRSEASGRVMLTVRVRFGDVDSRGDLAVDFPSTAPVPGRLPGAESPASAAADSSLVPSARPVSPPGLLGSSWAMPAGVTAIIVGILGVAGLGIFGRATRQASVLPDPDDRQSLIARLTRRAATAADRVLGEERRSGLDRSLERAGLEMRPAEFVVLSASAGLVLVAGALIVAGPVGGILAGVLILLGPRAVLVRLATRRRNAFSEQFEATLQMISGSLRAGYGLMQAVSTVAEEAPAPTSEEFGRVVVENQLGRSVEDSLRSMAVRMDDEDLAWVVEAIDIQYEVGGDMAEVLDTVGETIRDRNQIRRQIKALSAEGRFSAMILITLPFALAALIALVSPDYLAELTGSGPGRLMLLGGLVLIAIGASWIRRIVKVVF